MSRRSLISIRITQSYLTTLNDVRRNQRHTSFAYSKTLVRPETRVTACHDVKEGDPPEGVAVDGSSFSGPGGPKRNAFLPLSGKL